MILELVAVSKLGPAEYSVQSDKKRRWWKLVKLMAPMTWALDAIKPVEPLSHFPSHQVFISPYIFAKRALPSQQGAVGLRVCKVL